MVAFWDKKTVTHTHTHTYTHTSACTWRTGQAQAAQQQHSEGTSIARTLTTVTPLLWENISILQGIPPPGLSRRDIVALHAKRLLELSTEYADDVLLEMIAAMRRQSSHAFHTELEK